MISVPCASQTCCGVPLARRSTRRPTYQISATSEAAMMMARIPVTAKTARKGSMNSFRNGQSRRGGVSVCSYST